MLSVSTTNEAFDIPPKSSNIPAPEQSTFLNIIRDVIMSLHHNLITLPAEKTSADVVAERHDIVLLFDATNCNPNGDPDTGNMPRLQPDTLKGLVTDVCLKRKVRNFFAQYKTDGTSIGEDDPEPTQHLFVREGAVIERHLEAASLDEAAKKAFLKYSVAGKKLNEEDWKKAGSKSKTSKKEKTDAEQPDESTVKKTKGNDLGEYRDRAFRDALCGTYFDVRYFGQVVSTEGPLKGSFYGQIRGPLQITFAESLDKILQLDFSITRCAVANEAEAEKKGDDNRTMGRKHAVPYGLYRCHIHFSPALAAKTGFTYGDLDNFLFALTRMMGDFGVDGSSARAGGMRVVGLVDFEHSTALGNAPAHKLFSLVTVKRVAKNYRESDDFPRDLNDYAGTAPDGEIYTVTNSYGLVTGCTTTKPAPKDGNQPKATITARRLIWDIPISTAAVLN